MNALIKANARDLEQELTWLAQLLNARFKSYFDEKTSTVDIFSILPPDFSTSDSLYARCIYQHSLNFAERVALILSLTPYIRPQLLDVFFYKNKTFDRRFSEFGGYYNELNGDFIPTGETLLFLLAANDLETRFTLQALFDHNHLFATYHILSLISNSRDDSPLKTPLRLSEEYLALFTTGKIHQPDFNTNFPARLIETQLNWDDLVLHPGTRKQVEEIETWIRHGATLMNDWGMAAKLRPGFRSLFYGPPGTGKTMTACLLGKATGHAVY